MEGIHMVRWLLHSGLAMQLRNCGGARLRRFAADCAALHCSVLWADAVSMHRVLFGALAHGATSLLMAGGVGLPNGHVVASPAVAKTAAT